MSAPCDIRPELRKYADRYQRLSQPGFRRWAKSALESDQVRHEVRPVAFLEKAIIEYLVDAAGIPTLQTALITVSDRVLRHMVRPTKAAGRGQTIPDEPLLNLPGHLRRSRACGMPSERIWCTCWRWLGSLASACRT